MLGRASILGAEEQERDLCYACVWCGEVEKEMGAQGSTAP